MKANLRPVGKNAPPRPRSSDTTSSSITACGAIVRAFASAPYPPAASYSASFVKSRSPTPPRTRSVAIAQLLHDAGGVAGLHVRAVAMVDGDDRRPAAAAEALDRPQGDGTVRRRLARRDTQLFFECLQNLLRADERARDVRAHLDHV